MQDQLKNRVDPQTFRDLVKDIPFAMFTTVMADGTLRSRPMVAQADAYRRDALVLHPHDGADHE